MAKAGSTAAAKEAAELAASMPRLPAPARVRALTGAARLAPARERLRRLAECEGGPPQVILMEGGDVELRVAMSLYWTCLLQCRGSAPAQVEAKPAGPTQASLLGAPPAPETTPETTAPPCEVPCLDCDDCMKALTGANRDVFFLDGRRAMITIDDVRGVRAVIGESPRGAGPRVIIMAEAHHMRQETANAMLKSLEEPRPGNSFSLLAPQREKLLPTIVSRSFVITLPWPHGGASTDSSAMHDADDELETDDAETLAATTRLVEGFAHFGRTGAGWFPLTAVKGTADKHSAALFCMVLQRVILAAMLQAAGEPSRQGVPGLPERLAAGADAAAAMLVTRLDLPGLRGLDAALAETEEAVEKTVNAALCLDWFVTRLALLIKASRERRQGQRAVP